MAAHWPGPLTLILPRRAGVAQASAGGQDSIGLRCPSHPVARTLLAEFRGGQGGIAAPSANRFGHVSPTTAQHVRDEFGARLATSLGWLAETYRLQGRLAEAEPLLRRALAIRGYAPALPGQGATQVLVTTEARWPAYAWSFPLGDGRANVGYGELVSGGVTRAELVAGLHRMLPGVEPTGLRAHRLPLSTGTTFAPTRCMR